MLGRDLAYALDPVAFAEACGIVLDGWQADVLTGDHRRALLLCSRQAGKSTVSALAALHEALFCGPALILLISPSQRQSGELFRRVMELYRALDGPEPVMESALRAEFVTGSRIVSLPGSEATVRSYSAVRLIVADEAARIPDDLYGALRPMQATVAGGGRLLALSTPYGRRGWFYQAWTHGGEAWARFKVTAAEVPRISPGFLAQERRELGELLYSQEYECRFVDHGESVFTSEIIERAFSRDVRPLFAA